jgi:antitoxin VapB
LSNGNLDYASKFRYLASTMERQLNIRSDEAYERAHRLAKRRGESVTTIVTEALRKAEEQVPAPEVSPEEAAETKRILRELAREGGRRKKPGATSDHSDFYDEFGLPK